MMYKATCLFLFSQALIFNVNAQNLTGKTIGICEDTEGWPPYTYNKNYANKDKPVEATGYAVDLIQSILAKQGIQVNVSFIPFARCIDELIPGNQYQITLNASYNETRAKKYHFSNTLYTMTNYYFYSKTIHPEGLSITRLEDLKDKKYKICGINGYNYEPYGFKTGEIDQGVHNIEMLITKIHNGRCDLFLERYEMMNGLKVTGQDYLSNPDLIGKAIPNMPKLPFYIMISKGYPAAETLKEIINQGIQDMHTSGEAAKLLQKYFPGVYNP